MNELKKLKQRWAKTTGRTMPLSIERLAVDRIKRAVELAEAGCHVFVPSEPIRPSDQGSSLREWDGESNN